MRERLQYALITPARDEAVNLPRLAQAIVSQTVAPAKWMIVDNGSTDGTAAVAREIAAAHSWVSTLEIPGESKPQRGGAAVRAFAAGIAALANIPEVVVNLDADVSVASDYFARLLDAFASDPKLGIASGTCWEFNDGSWRPQYVTRNHVRGAARAYRRECLLDVVPLVENVGWDGIDELKAQTRGWRVRSIPELTVFHHRKLGRRERRLSIWLEQGEVAHFMGYRPSYLVIRSMYRAVGDPAALAMPFGYLRAVLGRRPQYDDTAVRGLLRQEQSLRRLPRRIREARGRT